MLAATILNTALEAINRNWAHHVHYKLKHFGHHIVSTPNNAFSVFIVYTFI